MEQHRPQILIADDNKSFAFVLAEYLSDKGYDADVALDGIEALEKISANGADLLIIDIMLPKKDGFEVIEDLRASGNHLPILCLTASTAKEDILHAYKLGCDDYQIKPCQMDVLLCRIAVLMRLTHTVETSTETVFDLGGKIFDSVHQTLGDEHLSARESDLLLMLCRNKGRVTERRRILLSLWKRDDFFVTRSLSVYINHLRHFLEGTHTKILVVQRRGYKLVDC